MGRLSAGMENFVVHFEVSWRFDTRGPPFSCEPGTNVAKHSWLSSTLGYISGGDDSAFEKLVPVGIQPSTSLTLLPWCPR